MKYLVIIILILFSIAVTFDYSNDETINKPIIISQSNQIIDFRDKLFTLEDHANCPMVIIGSLEEEPTVITENIVIQNLRLDGNKDFQDYEIWHNKENYIRNNGISIRRCKNVIIRNCVITNTRSGNIVIEKGCENILIENCILTRAFFDGIAGCASSGCVLRNNVIMDNDYAGISFDLQMKDNDIYDNYITGNDIGVFLRYSDNNIFNRNTMKNKSFDFYINQVNDDISTIPRDNLFRDNTTSNNFINQK